MPPLMIVKVKVGTQARLQLGHACIIDEIHMFILDRPPEAFDEDVVQCSTPAIHADANAGLFQRLCKRRGGKLYALICVKDFRATLRQGRLQGIETEQSIQRIGELPGDDVATEPVQDGDEIHEALCHRNVSNVGAPYLIGMLNRHPAEQVGLDPMSGPWHGRPRFRENSL
jgi:hypothetical protein